MNDHQVGQTINLIFDDIRLRNLKPDDFKLCFNRMKSGYYGKSYDRIDGQIILEALNHYTDERMNECENLSIKRHSEQLEDRDVPVNPEGQKKVLEILKESLKDAPMSNFIKEENKKRVIEKSARDRYIQKCFIDFYNLWKDKPYKAPKQPPCNIPGVLDRENSGKFILYNVQVKEGNMIKTVERPIDEVEYVQIKVKEYDTLISKGEDLKL